MNKTDKKANLSLQVIPINVENAYPIIDASIKVIQDSGIRYKVQPFATIMEGALSDMLATVMEAKEAALDAGAEELILNIQIHLKKEAEVSFEDKTDAFKG